jgi:hypothetical protein
VRCVYVRWAYNSAHVYTADSAFNVTAVACALAAELRVVCAQRIGSTAKLYTVTLYPVSLDFIFVWYKKHTKKYAINSPGGFHFWPTDNTYYTYGTPKYI